MRTQIRAGLLIVLFAAFGWVANPVSACSGGSPMTIRGALNFADYAAHVTVMEADDLGQNAIVRVESYLSGGQGPAHVLLSRQDPTRTAYVVAGQSSGGDCLGILASFSPGDDFYAFLGRNPDGSHRLVTTLFNASFLDFPEPTSTVEVFLEGIEGNGNFAEKGTGLKVTEAEFLELVAEESGTEPIPAQPNTPYPLYAPLRLDLESGEAYMLPVDFGELVPLVDDATDLSTHPLWHYGFSDAGTCEVENCIQISPNNLNVAVQVDENMIQFSWGATVTGQSSLFSATSDAVAVWDQCTLSIYATGYPRLGHEWYAVQLLNSTELTSVDNRECASLTANAVWHPNGRTLVYADADGLWTWDVFDSSAPMQLLISTEDDVPTAHYFSPMGRYLAVTAEEDKFTLDTVTDERLPDGIVSPDERILLTFVDGEAGRRLGVCALTPYSCSMLGGNMFVEKFTTNGERESITWINEVTDVLWTGETTFLAQVCLPDEPLECSIFGWGPPSAFGGWQLPQVASKGYAFDYDFDNRQLASVEALTIIRIENEMIDLANQLDGSIAATTWMPSLFYRE